ncbi:MAG: sensor histidine kinase [Salibacteraceae bacterium]
MRLLIITFIVVVSFSSKGFSQNFHFKNFQVENGLPSSQIYDIKQDSKGNIWLASDLGLTQYNSYTFTSYSEKDGLSDNAIVKLFVDHNNWVWCLGANRSITIFRNDSIIPYTQANALIDSVGYDFIRGIYVDQDSKLYLSISQPCYEKAYALAMDSKGNIERIKYNEGFYYDPIKTDFFGGNSCPGTPSILQTQNKKHVFHPTHGSILSVAYNNNKGYIITDKKVMDFGNIKAHYFSSTPTGSSLIDSRGNLWVSTYSGILFFKKSSMVYQPIELLKNRTITSVMEDQDGSIWIGTQSKGVYFIKNTQALVFDNLFGIEEPNITSIGGGKSVYFSDSRNNQYQFDGNSVNKMGTATSAIQDIIIYNWSPLFIENQRRGDTHYSFFKNGLCITEGNNKTIWVGKINGFAAYKNKIEVFNSASLKFKYRVNSIYIDSNQNIWLGTLSGLFKFNGKTIDLIEATKGFRIDKIDFWKGKIVFSSRGEGVGIINENDITFYNQENGLISNFTNDLQVYGDEIWVATNGGISQIKNDVIRSITKADGIPTSEINNIFINDYGIYIGSRKGFIVLDKSYLERPSRTLGTEIISVFQGNSNIEKSRWSKLLLPFEQNGLKIELLAREFRLSDPIQYRYRISNDSSWSYSSTNIIQYGSLPTGNWVFQCAAQNELGEWGTTNSTLSFEVEKPYYLKWWFWLCIVILIGGVFWAISQYRYSLARKDELTQNELNQLKIKALSSQMNPHFIFNSLNSIQNFIVDNDVRMSNKYLTKFARLMRLILNNSNETFVPLKDVLATLKLYMELEQLRFNNKFDYTINTGPGLEIDSTKVPSMLLQPFVENAILHGILPLEGNGIVTINMHRLADQSIQVSIQDNGVGREFHKNKLGKKHKSHGLRITQERLKVFESLLGNKFNLIIRDLKDEEGKPKGTEIELLLPCR